MMRKRLAALENSVRSQISQDLEATRFQLHKIHQLNSRIIPLREKALQYVQKWSGRMQISRSLRLEAQRDLFHSRLAEARRTLLDLISFRPYVPDYHLALALVLRREGRRGRRP